MLSLNEHFPILQSLIILEACISRDLTYFNGNYYQFFLILIQDRLPGYIRSKLIKSFPRLVDLFLVYITNCFII